MQTSSLRNIFALGGFILGLSLATLTAQGNVWTEAQTSLKAIQAAALAKEQGPIHDEQEKLVSALKQLQAKGGAADPGRFNGAITNAISASDKVHVASDANDFVKVAASLKTLEATMAMVEKQLPPQLAPLRCELVGVQVYVAGKSAEMLLRLIGSDGQPLTLDQLQLTHTEKIHLLVLDETLTDYHHEHPTAGDKPGEYRFEFSPRFGGTYHIWADVTPTATGQQEYVRTLVQVQGPPPSKNRNLNTTTEADGYRFSLTMENNEPLQTGKAAVIKIKVTTLDGKDFSALEPVMGAFAHMVAFPESLISVTHVHPMGKEPTTATERGGPELSFHVEPSRPGFQKLFLQTQIGGREVYAAFGLEVQPGSGSAPHVTSEYTCPMHPEVKQATPGKCPKCGMALVASGTHDHQHDH